MQSDSWLSKPIANTSVTFLRDSETKRMTGYVTRPPVIPSHRLSSAPGAPGGMGGSLGFCFFFSFLFFVSKFVSPFFPSKLSCSLYRNATKII